MKEHESKCPLQKKSTRWRIPHNLDIKFWRDYNIELVGNSKYDSLEVTCNAESQIILLRTKKK